MAEAEETLPEIYLQPGESCLVKEPAILRTLLGSCVGVAFWAPRLGLGALCHPVLPRFPVKQASTLTRSAGRRYVDYAIRDLAQQFDALGARRNEIEVKVFGGGDVLETGHHSTLPTVGSLNIEVAVKVLEEESFYIMASSLGGRRGVNIYFNTKTGEVLLQRHSRNAIEAEEHAGAADKSGRKL